MTAFDGWQFGNCLNTQDRAEVLRSYVHRFTREHVPAWSRQPMPNGQAYQPQYESDAQWLACTQFRVRRDGRLDKRARSCMSFAPVTIPDSKGTPLHA